MMPVSSQAANATAAAATQAHNPYFPGYGLYFSYAQGPMYPPSHPAALYPVQQAQNPAVAAAAAAAAAANSPFATKANTTAAAANYGSHSYNSAGYDSMGNAGGVPTQADYATTSNKPYQQQQQHKQMTTVGGNAGQSVGGGGGGGNDLSSTATNMYSKAHPQMNKVWPSSNRRGRFF